MDLKEQYEKLLRYCYMKTQNRFLAEDIVQDTFLRFWESHSYKDTGKEMAYLYTIARNLCVDNFRTKGHLNIEDYENALTEEKTEQDTVLTRIEIEHALKKLPEDLQEILILRYVSELSAADIGKVMCLSRFTVHRRLKSGLALLRAELEGEENER